MKKILAIIAIVSLAFYLPSCKGKVKDSDVKTAVESAIASNSDLSGLAVEVNDGVATLTGEVKDETAKAAAQQAAIAVNGVKSVQNNLTIAAPPPPPTPAITADDPLTTAVRDATKDNPGVTAEVKDGVVTLTGEIRKSDLPKLMQKINATRPKKIENKLTVK